MAEGTCEREHCPCGCGSHGECFIYGDDKTLMQVLADGFIAWRDAPRKGRRAEYEYVHDAILANPDAVLDALDHKDVMRWLRARAVKG